MLIYNKCGLRSGASPGAELLRWRCGESRAADHNTEPLSQIIWSHVNQSYSDHGKLCSL